MSKATFIPAVTETKTIEVEPAKVSLELSIREAQVLRGLVGNTNTELLSDLYRQLGVLHDQHDIPRKRITEGPSFDIASLR